MNWFENELIRKRINKLPQKIWDLNMKILSHNYKFRTKRQTNKHLYFLFFLTLYSLKKVVCYVIMETLVCNQIKSVHTWEPCPHQHLSSSLCLVYCLTVYPSMVTLRHVTTLQPSLVPLTHLNYCTWNRCIQSYLGYLIVLFWNTKSIKVSFYKSNCTKHKATQYLWY